MDEYQKMKEKAKRGNRISVH